jgi:DNA (cytosine-5)-methyltransferase 1
MIKLRLLDLFCGAGGAAMGYHRAGFEVVGVDIKPQPRYPFQFWQEDALELLARFIELAAKGFANLKQFDAIHASPPCQAFSDLAWHPQNKDVIYPDLVTPLRPLLEATGLPYVIENVEGAPLNDPVMLCGSSVGLSVRRHRLFEANFPLMVPPCSHGQQKRQFKVWRHGREMLSAVVPVYGTGGGKAADSWPEAMGIDWMTRAEMAEAIPPAYTELIGHQLMSHIQARSAA